MVVGRYKEGKLAGFLIAMPDYGSLFIKMTPLNLAKFSDQAFSQNGIRLCI